MRLAVVAPPATVSAKQQAAPATRATLPAPVAAGTTAAHTPSLTSSTAVTAPLPAVTAVDNARPPGKAIQAGTLLPAAVNKVETAVLPPSRGGSSARGSSATATPTLATPTLATPTLATPTLATPTLATPTLGTPTFGTSTTVNVGCLTTSRQVLPRYGPAQFRDALFAVYALHDESRGVGLLPATADWLMEPLDASGPSIFRAHLFKNGN